MRMRATALRSAESADISSVIKLSTPISLIVIASSFLGVAGVIPSEKKFHRSRLIVVDAISVMFSYLRCAQCVDKNLRMLGCLRFAPICLNRFVRVETAKVRPG